MIVRILFTTTLGMGLQVEGKPEVSKIIFTADAGIETFNLAVALQADMVVVHHGMFWQGINPSVVGATKNELLRCLIMEFHCTRYICH